MTDQTYSIEVQGISFYYQTGHVLEDISFNVSVGEYLGIIGPNGGGKTTLVKILLGLLKPSSGSVKLFGYDNGRFKERFRLGYVPQRASTEELLFPATVEEVVRSGRTARAGFLSRFSQSDKNAIEKAIEITAIGHLKKKLIGRLSGGERQRVLIARALAGEPEIIFLDEPAVGVDIASQEQFYTVLGQLNKNLSLTIVFISHDVGVIAKEVDTVLCLNRKLICHGRPENYIKEEFLQQLYGRKVQSVLHNACCPF
jgi:zinc transport system ATP-binding protein